MKANLTLTPNLQMMALALALTLVLACGLPLTGCFRITPQVRWAAASLPAVSSTRRYSSMMPPTGGFGADDDDENDEENYVGMNMQYDEIPPFLPGMSDDEKAMLEALREERVVSNDRWQSTMLRDNHGGEWSGMYELYVPSKGPSGFSMSKADAGTVHTSITAGEFQLEGVPLYFNEAYTTQMPAPSPLLNPTAASLLLAATRESYESTDFRPSGGNQVVANTFTLCRVSDGLRLPHAPDPMEKVRPTRIPPPAPPRLAPVVAAEPWPIFPSSARHAITCRSPTPTWRSWRCVKTTCAPAYALSTRARPPRRPPSRSWKAGCMTRFWRALW